jgi:rhodanese-related sulfurtransferase
MHSRFLPLAGLLPHLPLLQDLAYALAIASLGLALGGLLNVFRSAPLPASYVSKEERLWAEVAALGTTASAEAARPLLYDELLEWLQEAREKGTPPPLILDARPVEFYRLAHIPDAWPLPRASFRQFYEQHRSTLSTDKTRRVVVYCQSVDCHDSGLVAAALGKLGHSQVSILAGGWEEWEKRHRP